jgi:hypothetical protein
MIISGHKRRRIRDLPTDLQRVVYSLDNTYREIFRRVIDQIKQTLSTIPRLELQFRPKFRLLFGSRHFALLYKTIHDEWRVSAICPDYDRQNSSVLLHASAILLYLRPVISIHSAEEMQRLEDRHVATELMNMP